MPLAYKDVSIDCQRLRMIEAALTKGAISGRGPSDRFGIMPLRGLADTGTSDDYEQWKMRFQNAAVGSGFPKEVARGLTGALGELIDNALDHSESVATACAVYQAHEESFEFTVSDAGIGALASLRQNPDHRSLSDSGAALTLAMSDGGSRYPTGSGHGTGIGSMFRAMAGLYGDLRFRSGDHECSLSGNHLDDKGRLQLTSKAALPGFTISVLCRRPASSSIS